MPISKITVIRFVGLFHSGAFGPAVRFPLRSSAVYEPPDFGPRYDLILAAALAAAPGFRAPHAAICGFRPLFANKIHYFERTSRGNDPNLSAAREMMEEALWLIKGGMEKKDGDDSPFSLVFYFPVSKMIERTVEKNLYLSLLQSADRSEGQLRRIAIPGGTE